MRTAALATLLLLGHDALALVATAAASSAGREPQQEERPLPRSYHGAAAVNGKIYVMGGAGADNKPVGSVQVYDPATGTWAARANMPTPRALFGTSAVGGTIYTIGGTTKGLDKLAVVEAYDTATDTWTRKADMPTPRNALATAVVDGKVYAIGGWGMDQPKGGWEALDPAALASDFATVEAYDPQTNTWAARADMPTPRSHITVSAVGGKIYVIGGGIPPRTAGTGKYHLQLEIYDTAANRWARAADLPTPRSVLSSSVLGGRIYAIGGAFSHGSSLAEIVKTLQILSVVEVYDPASGRWTRGKDLNTPRGWFSTSTLNGKLYLVGGRSPGPDGARSPRTLRFRESRSTHRRPDERSRGSVERGRRRSSQEGEAIPPPPAASPALQWAVQARYAFTKPLPDCGSAPGL